MIKKNPPSISTLTTEGIAADFPIEIVTPERGTGVSKKELLFVAGATLAALALRIVMLRFTGVITSDGVWYSLLGKNLIAGDFEGGLSTYWAPLYPFLIGVTSLIVEDLELAGRLVSVVSGALLVIPVYVLSRRLYGRTEAAIAALLIIVCPPLISTSTRVLTESLYTLLFTLSVVVAVSALTREKRWLFLLTGAGFGACYLVKPEAIGFAALIVVAALSKRLFTRNADVRTLLAGALLAFIGFAVVSLPYVLYLRSETGKWTVSAKLAGSFGIPATGNKWRGLIEDGQTTLADKLWSVGSSRASGEAPAEHRGSAADSRGVAAEFGQRVAESEEVGDESGSAASESEIPLRMPQPRNVARNLYVEYINLVDSITPSLFFLAGLGLVGTGWSRKRSGQEGYLFLFVISTLVGYAIVGFISSRYLVVLIPIVICWSARGVVALESCLVKIEREVRQSEGLLERHRPALRVALLICLGALLAPSLPRSASAQRGTEKQIAMWIKEDSEPVPPLIMASGPLMAFLSGGKHLYTPAEEYNVVLDYARRKGVSYFVVEERSITLTWKLNFLLDDTRDHPGLELVHRDDTRRRKVRVFKLTKPPDGPDPNH